MAFLPAVLTTACSPGQPGAPDKRRKTMVAYYENEAAVEAALKKTKTPEEVLKIAHDLEQRMAPSHWIQKALRVLYAMD